MEHSGGCVHNKKNLCLLKDNSEITIPYNKNIHDKPFKVVINNNDDRSDKEIASIILDVLPGRG